jgi:hypothetical protein
MVDEMPGEGLPVDGVWEHRLRRDDPNNSIYYEKAFLLIVFPSEILSLMSDICLKETGGINGKSFHRRPSSNWPLQEFLQSPLQQWSYALAGRETMKAEPLNRKPLNLSRPHPGFRTLKPSLSCEERVAW